MIHNKALRIFRIMVQVTVLVIVTWAIMATPAVITGTLLDTVKHWQLIPMAMLGTMSIVGVWLVVTLIFGRVYCSTMCPLGTLQDISARLPLLFARKKPYRYKPGYPWYVRAAMITILVMAVCFDSLAVSWSIMPFLQVSPFGSYEDMVTTLAMPLARWLSIGDTVPVAARIALSASINLVFIVSVSAVRGREICNVLCPVGVALGTVNTMALFHFDIDTDRCTHCRRCEDVCKASCIDSEIGTVDYHRCVVCFDCIAACNDDAIHYTTRRHRLSLPMLQSIARQPRPALSQNLEIKSSYNKNNDK